jgi:hypothetical protein
VTSAVAHNKLGPASCTKISVATPPPRELAEGPSHARSTTGGPISTGAPGGPNSTGLDISPDPPAEVAIETEHRSTSPTHARSATQNHRPPVDKQPFFIETNSERDALASGSLSQCATCRSRSRDRGRLVFLVSGIPLRTARTVCEDRIAQPSTPLDPPGGQRSGHPAGLWGRGTRRDAVELPEELAAWPS